MQQYLDLLKYTLVNGREKTDRTGTGTISVFGTQNRYCLANDKMPIVTTKKVFTKGVIEELLWMLSGSTNINTLKEKGVNIWNEWAAENGELGPVYGKMWRAFPANEQFGLGVKKRSVDQIKELEDGLRNNPESRRHIVSGWNPALLPDTSLAPHENAAKGKQALPPCHTMFQFICEPMTLEERVDWFIKSELEANELLSHDTHAGLDDYNVPKYYLSCQLYQRSGDLFLGVPFNVMSYSLLTHMLAKTHNMVAREFIHTMGDAHIYKNHVEQVEKQLKRKPKTLPTVRFAQSNYESVLDFTADDIEIVNYKHYAAIKGSVAV